MLEQLRHIYSTYLFSTGVEKNSLSFVGRVFFSFVSVFFSLDLSKLATSATSGLSAIVSKQNRFKCLSDRFQEDSSVMHH